MAIFFNYCFLAIIQISFYKCVSTGTFKMQKQNKSSQRHLL